MRVAPCLANGCNTRHSFSNSPEIGSLAGKIHPGLVALWGNDRLAHCTLPIRDRAHLIMGRANITLGPKIARRLTERPLDNPLTGEERAFDYDLGIRRNEQVIPPHLRRRKPQRFSQVAA